MARTAGRSRSAIEASCESIVEEHRELIETVADGDDKPAEWARQWLQGVDNDA